MANSNQRNQQLAAASAAVVADDPVLKKKLGNLINQIVDYQSLVMKVGSPGDKLSLVKAVLPQMLSAMGSVQQSEQEAAERAAIERIYAEMRGETVQDQGTQLKAV